MPLSQFRAYKSQQILVYCAVAGTALIIPRMRLAQPLPNYLINIKAIMHHTAPKSISYLCAKITNLEAKFPVRLKFAKSSSYFFRFCQDERYLCGRDMYLLVRGCFRTSPSRRLSLSCGRPGPRQQQKVM